MDNQPVVFQYKTIRQTLHKEEWWFAVAKVVAVQADSPNHSD
jgi:prophage antirepressor-like protein